VPAKKKASKKAAKKPQVTFSFPKAKTPRTKSETLRVLAEATGLARKDVGTTLSALSALIGQDLTKVGVFTLPGLAKLTVVKKKATRARKGINPFTGEPTTFKAKPARKLVKIRPVKALKDVVA
jgi:nucleoid DNA-binding protein